MGFMFRLFPSLNGMRLFRIPSFSTESSWFRVYSEAEFTIKNTGLRNGCRVTTSS